MDNFLDYYSCWLSFSIPKHFWIKPTSYTTVQSSTWQFLQDLVMTLPIFKLNFFNKNILKKSFFLITIFHRWDYCRSKTTKRKEILCCTIICKTCQYFFDLARTLPIFKVKKCEKMQNLELFLRLDGNNGGFLLW